MNSVVVPSFQMDDLATAVLEYDHEFDILAIRFGEPESADTDPVGDGWYVRTVDDRLVGLELHGFVELQLVHPALEKTLAPAIEEIHAVTASGFEADFEVAPAAARMVSTSSAIAVLVGSALARAEAALLSDAAETAAALRASA
ncbi:MAG: hypothetical protein ACSLFM_11670 [Tepidiformaceae bacterium]